MGFNEWIDVFLEEKEIEIWRTLEFTTDEGNFHIIPVKVIIELIKKLDKQQKQIVKNKLVKMDFLNQSIMEYLKELAKILVE